MRQSGLRSWEEIDLSIESVGLLSFSLLKQNIDQHHSFLFVLHWLILRTFLLFQGINFTKCFRCQYINRDNLVTLVDLIPHEHHRLWLTIYNGSWSLWRRSVGRYSRSASATRTSSRLTAPGSTSTLAITSNIWLCTWMLTEGIHFTRINPRVQV